MSVMNAGQMRAWFIIEGWEFRRETMEDWHVIIRNYRRDNGLDHGEMVVVTTNTAERKGAGRTRNLRASSWDEATPNILRLAFEALTRDCSNSEEP